MARHAALRAAVGVLALVLLARAQADPLRVLTQAMFDRGTVILTTPGTYVLTENSVFNPNPRSRGGDSNPRPEQFVSAGGNYDDAAYGLGFFAAVVIAGPGITLDLNGFEMTQHAEHRLQQRFYTHIELATAPFITGQGPHDFAPTRDPTVPRFGAVFFYIIFILYLNPPPPF
jgi:hypothetical protein